MLGLATVYVTFMTIVAMLTPSTGVPLQPLAPDPADYMRVGLAAYDPPHNPPLTFSPYDENGCCVSCGYTYCGTLVQCVRAWETPCPPLINPFAPEPLASVDAYPVYEVPKPEGVQLKMPEVAGPGRVGH